MEPEEDILDTTYLSLNLHLKRDAAARLRSNAREIDLRNHGAAPESYTVEEAVAVIVNETGRLDRLPAFGWHATPSTGWDEATSWLPQAVVA